MEFAKDAEYADGLQGKTLPQEQKPPAKTFKKLGVQIEVVEDEDLDDF